MMGRFGGLTKSPAKPAASRENAKLGGRPGKPAVAWSLSAHRSGRFGFVLFRYGIEFEFRES